MTTMQEAFKEFCDQYVAPSKGTICAAVGAGDGVLHAMSIGHPDMLSDLAVGLIDKYQDGMFTKQYLTAREHMTLVNTLFKSPTTTMSISICVDGEWKRLTSYDELRAALS